MLELRYKLDMYEIGCLLAPYHKVINWFGVDLRANNNMVRIDFTDNSSIMVKSQDIKRLIKEVIEVKGEY